MSTILVIEDDIALNETICEILETQGYEVQTAFNGMEGLEIAFNKEIDLIICDINMPLLNGFETIKIFRESEQHIQVPFLFLSAMYSMEQLRIGMNLGADDFIT